MKSKMLGALALLTLLGALFVMQSAGGENNNLTPNVNAATGTIAAMNVGTCLTTDDDVFKGDCDSLANDVAGTDNDWEVREKITEVDTLYATYAFDPKTASDEPRVILKDSDLIKVSIADSGRDKRTGVLIRGASYTGVNNSDAAVPAGFDEDLETSLAKVIVDDLDELDIPRDDDPYNATPGATTDDDTTPDIAFKHEDAIDDGIEIFQGTAANSIITNSGNYVLNFNRAGNVRSATDEPWPFPPMYVGAADIDSVIRFYGCEVDDDGAEADCATTSERLDDITVDEDRSAGGGDGSAPWLSINASVPEGSDFIILAVYYQTSEVEDLVGGQTYRHCGDGNNLPTESNDVWTCSAGTLGMNDTENNVVFTKKEQDDNKALVVKASADGDQASVNLHLRETGRFDGNYQGYLRLTDANGDGRGSTTTRGDWGRQVKNGTGPSDTDADVAVLGVESGPVTIEYVDTDGKTQRLRIDIDRQPPAIEITAPVHGSSGDDRTPDFFGTIEDIDSGLTAESFRLVVDNRAEASNNEYALQNTDYKASTVDLKTNQSKLRNANDFAAPSSEENYVIGVADPDIYDLGDDDCDSDNVDSPCYIEADRYEDGDNNASFDESVNLDFNTDTRDKEFDVDFQAFVLDQAGNIGFSDSDPINPRYISDLGTDKADRDGNDEAGRNVFGYYSAHIIILDEKDPDIIEDQSATGYYGRSGDNMVADRAGVMVVFDGPIEASTVSTNTFSVELDDKSAAEVIDVDVDGKYVFLKLANELASDATPMIDIVQGEKVEDMAGNETFGREQDAFKAKDGITPKLTVTLSGGSGTGTGNEGPDKLTKDQITVNIASDEALQGSPNVLVVCSSIEWKDTPGGSDQDIDDLVANRSGAFKNGDQPGEETVHRTTPPTSNANARGKTYQYTCGYDVDDDNFDDDFSNGSLQRSSSLSRPGDNWEFTWQPNGTGLQDGALTVVAFARDRSRYQMGDNMVENWGSASAEFMLDTVLKSPTEDGGGETQPANDGTSKETRPFILFDFNEATTVTLESVELDDVEIKDEFERPEENRFVYWPLTLVRGDHEVVVEASDAAGNEVEFELNFEVAERGDFIINLLAGWNAISVPADPVDTAIGSVFSNSAVDTVIGWDTQGWRIAVRRDGVWESSQQQNTLNEVRSRYGYWVKSRNFVQQPVKLVAPDREGGGARVPVSIDTNPGWNFVGVIDQDGDQTEGDSGTSLKSGNEVITAGDYLRSSTQFVRAYTWDATFSRFEALRADDAMTIGDGVWVYFEGGIAP